MPGQSWDEHRENHERLVLHLSGEKEPLRAGSFRRLVRSLRKAFEVRKGGKKRG
jgi:hypothetical protein